MAPDESKPKAIETATARHIRRRIVFLPLFEPTRRQVTPLRLIRAGGVCQLFG
jgi:hypothetical protein